MYERFWNLKKRPFDEAFDPETYFPGEKQQGILLKLRYCAEQRRSGAVLVGASGVGKSFLVQQMLAALPDSIRPRPLVVFPQMPPSQLLALIASELTGTPTRSRDVGECVAEIDHFLGENAKSGNHALMAVDEAHLLREPEALETVRLLMNFQCDGRGALTLLLIGQPQLLIGLRSVSALVERMLVKCVLPAFSQEETASYIEHKLAVAGAPPSVFSREAIDLVFHYSGGNPRRIDRLCDLGLLVGFAEDRTQVGPEQIRDVAEELVGFAEHRAA